MSIRNHLSSQRNLIEIAPGQQFVADTFDLSAGYYSDSLCAFCHQGADAGKHMHSLLHSSTAGLLDSDSSGSEDGATRRTAAGSSLSGRGLTTPFKRSSTLHLDPKRIWMSEHPLYVRQARIECVHLYCALFAPMSWLKNRVWYNVAREVRRSQHFQCTHCGLKGANLACQHKKCGFVAHLPCALELGWIPSLMNKVQYLCPAHKQEETLARNEQFQVEMRDVSRGREAAEVLAGASCLDEAMNAPYYYIAENVDSSDISLSLRHVQSLGFCSCGYDGICHPVSDSSNSFLSPCPCLRNEQYYLCGPYKCLRLPNSTRDGRVVESTSKPERIIECGLRCQCSKRCMNRVVGNGTQFSFSIDVKRLLSPVPAAVSASSATGQGSSRASSGKGSGTSHPNSSATIATSSSPSLSRQSSMSPPQQGHKKRFRSMPGAGTDSEKIVRELKEWCIYALQDIPVGAFVCEYVGQYVRGKTHVQVPLQLHFKTSDLNDAIHESSVADDLITSLLPDHSTLRRSSSIALRRCDRGLDGCGGIAPVGMWEADFALVDAALWCKLNCRLPLQERSSADRHGGGTDSATVAAPVPSAKVKSGHKTKSKAKLLKGKTPLGGAPNRTISGSVEFAADSGADACSEEDHGEEESAEEEEEVEGPSRKATPDSRASGAGEDVKSSGVLPDIREEKFIDTRYYGNFSRLIRLTRDREESNLLRRCVYIDDTEHLLPRLALFASRPIAKGEELVLF